MGRPLGSNKKKTEPAVAAAPPEPVFDPERLAVTTYSAEGGAGFIQGKNMFARTGKFLGEAPQHLWYITTPEQEENNRRARARQRMKFSTHVNAAVNRAAIPDKLLDVARENARALAAEAFAE